MKIRSSIALLFLGAAAFLAPIHHAGAAEGSLYDPKSAQTVGPDLQRIFGPKSAGIRYDKRMIRAAQIAAARANKHSSSRCWSYVKNALVAAKVIPTRPDTAYAKEAAAELTGKYGFTKLRIKDPYKAPVGSVLVYGGRGPGHVEFRTAYGFVSDFPSLKPSSRPLIGVYVKRT
jgi:hypothetical protein